MICGILNLRRVRSGFTLEREHGSQLYVSGNSFVVRVSTISEGYLQQFVLTKATTPYQRPSQYGYRVMNIRVYNNVRDDESLAQVRLNTGSVGSPDISQFLIMFAT